MQSQEKSRRRRLAPALTAVATAGVMAVGFTQLGGASATQQNGSGSCRNQTQTSIQAPFLARAGVVLGKHKPGKPRTVTVTRTRTKTVTKWKVVHHCKTVTATYTTTQYEPTTVTYTTTVLPDSVLTE